MVPSFVTCVFYFEYSKDLSLHLPCSHNRIKVRTLFYLLCLTSLCPVFALIVLVTHKYHD